MQIARIATGDEPDDAPDDGKDKAAQALGREGGKKPNRPLRYKQPTGTTETIGNKGVTLAMADARKPRG